MAEVFYASGSELATLTNLFEVDGVATDPGTVTLIVTAPGTAPVTYTYAAAEITKTGTGAYRKDVAVPTDGLWAYTWIGTTPAVDVVAGSWEVRPTAVERLYVSLGLLKSSLGITDTDRDAILMQKLTAAARGIDSYCGKPLGFYLASSATARTYRTQGRIVCDLDGERLLVDEIGSTSGLVVETGTAGGSTWTTVTDYETAPDNALAAGRPIDGLRRLVSTWSNGDRLARVRVTARWGWPAVPGVVAEACLLQASRLYKRKDSPEGVAGTQEWGGIRVARIDPDVQALLYDLATPVVG
jgi:hypothetical protein